MILHDEVSKKKFQCFWNRRIQTDAKVGLANSKSRAVCSPFDSDSKCMRTKRTKRFFYSVQLQCSSKLKKLCRFLCTFGIDFIRHYCIHDKRMQKIVYAFNFIPDSRTLGQYRVYLCANKHIARAHLNQSIFNANEHRTKKYI